MLAQAGYVFEVCQVSTRELTTSDLSLRELTLANAILKARAGFRLRPDAVVVAADTLVALDGETIGKPANLDDARKTLRKLSGRTHEVCTGVRIISANGVAAWTDISRVRFKRLSASAIESYLRKIDPLDKAGAYAAQENGVIASVAGSFTNVVGLPMERIRASLRDFGIEPGRQGGRI